MNSETREKLKRDELARQYNLWLKKMADQKVKLSDIAARQLVPVLENRMVDIVDPGSETVV